MREEGQAARRFWELLGFHEVEPPETLRDRAAWMERRGTQVHLLWTEQPVAPPKGHTAVVADDYGATLERLAADGYEIEHREQHWGAPRAVVAGPGGHRVELMAAPPS